MAVPALPGDDSDSNDWNAAKVNAIYDHLQWWRDTRPLFIGRGKVGNINNATDTDLSMSDGSGNFLVTPTTNVGGFAASSSNAEVEIPEAGIYQVDGYTRFAANTTGYRQISLDINGTTLVRSLVKNDAVATGVTPLIFSVAVDLGTASDGLVIVGHQTSGGALNTSELWMSIRWLQST